MAVCGDTCAKLLLSGHTLIVGGSSGRLEAVYIPRLKDDRESALKDGKQLVSTGMAQGENQHGNC